MPEKTSLIAGGNDKIPAAQEQGRHPGEALREHGSGNGKKVSTTNVVTKVDADHFTWQATKVTVDGKPVPDGASVKMKRVKEDRPQP